MGRPRIYEHRDKFGNGLVEKVCPSCNEPALMKVRDTYCSTGCADVSKLGSGNARWKGKDASYIAKHVRVYQLRGKAESCVWGCSNGPFEWANLLGDYDDPGDFASMCKSCHARFDAAKKVMEEGFTGFRHAKLTAERVLDARIRYAAGETLGELSDRYDVSKMALSQAIRGKTWGWA